MRSATLLPIPFLLASLFTPALGAEGNVVLFITDDQGQHAGCYGTPNIQTPHLDELAADGTLYTHAFATTASCSASRSVILSGLHNHRNGHYGHKHGYNHFSSFDWVKSLPNLLREAAGYRTARIGKYHVAPEEVYEFDRALRGRSRNPVQMAEASREFIEQSDDEPFFLLFATSDPHRGGGWTEEHGVKANRFGNRPEGRSRDGIDPVEYSPDEVAVPPFLPDTPTCRAELAQYYQSVSRIDQGLGRLVAVLRETGVYDETLIIYLSDHGIAFPGGKTTAYEGGLRCPCIVRSPGQDTRGVVSDAMISWVDITPTILEFAGVLEKGSTALPEELGTMEGGEPYRFHGRSFLSTVDGDADADWDRIYASHTFHEITMYYPMRVVRGRRWKLIWNIAHDLPYPFASDLWAAPTFQVQYAKGMDAPYGPRTVGEYIHRPEFELYDLKSDPHESNNLAGAPEHSERLAEMKRRIKRFQQETGDPWVLKWDYE